MKSPMKNRMTSRKSVVKFTAVAVVMSLACCLVGGCNYTRSSNPKAYDNTESFVHYSLNTSVVEESAQTVADSSIQSGNTYEKISTTQEYITNLDIPVGDKTEIVLEEGTLGETAYYGLLENGGWYLGMSEDHGILVLNEDGYNIEKVKADGSNEVLLTNIMGDRGKKPECISWDGSSYIAWAESPHANEWYDETLGSDWAVYVANLETGTIILVDEDIGLQAEENAAHNYLAPSNISIQNGYLSYKAYAQREDGKIVEAIKLYDIAKDSLTTIDFLDGDPSNHGMGCPSICDGKVAWSQAYIRDDSLYEGYSVIYDCNTGEKSIVETDENIINPILSTGYLIGENNPNRTFYDSEIVMYSFKYKSWKYKISPDFPDYKAASANGVNLGAISTWDDYVTWSGSVLTNVVVMDLEKEVLYTITEGKYDISNIALYPGGLLVWQERYFDDAGLHGQMNYAILKK